MSPNSTARHRPTIRKLGLCAAALLVTVLPTACDSAHAEQTRDTSVVGHAGHHAQGVATDAIDDPGVVEVANAQAAPPAADDGAADGSAESAAETTGADPSAVPDADAGAEAAARNGRPGDEDRGRGEPGQDEAGRNEQGQDRGRGDGGRGNGRPGDGRPGDGRPGDGRPGPGRPGAGPGNGGQQPTPPPGNGGQPPAPPANGDNNGLDVLGRDCSQSRLEPHDGFQEAPRCVSTAFGEVAAADRNPSLLITQAPQTVRAGEDFTLAVTTRNLVRDRFLGAAAGGYYLESSFLDENGIQRGHFHTACRMLDALDTAPNPGPNPEFFLATQDNRGGADPDTVTVTVTGMPRAGTVQCAVWAGDGSHRLPMMERANQIPAFDIVRITVQ